MEEGEGEGEGLSLIFALCLGGVNVRDLLAAVRAWNTNAKPCAAVTGRRPRDTLWQRILWLMKMETRMALAMEIELEIELELALQLQIDKGH